MKKTLPTILFLLICFVVTGQKVVSDTTMFFGKVINDYTYLRNIPEEYSKNSNYVMSNEPVFIFSFEKSKSNVGYYGVFKDSLKGYLSENEIDLPLEHEEYLKENSGENNIRLLLAERNSKLYLLSKLNDEVNQYKKYKQKGLVLLNKKFSYAEYGSQFGLNLKFYNGYTKDIKYIDVTVRPYNRVGDLMRDDIGRDVVRVKVIGPLKSDYESSVDFDNMFWDDRDVISYLVITYMKVTFMDGTVKELKEIKKHLGEGVYNGKGE